MDRIEIRPRLLNAYTVMYGTVALVTSIVFGKIWYKSYILYLQYPTEPTFTHVMLASVLPVIIFSIFLLVAIKSTLGRIILVENNLLYFKRRAGLGFGAWGIDKIVDLSKIKSITDRQKNYFVSTGKGIVPVTAYWIIFNDELNSKQEILLNGWNVHDIKSLFYYIKGKYPKIVFNNNILADPPTKIAGVEDLLKDK